LTLVGFLEVSLGAAIYQGTRDTPIGPGTVLTFWLSALVLLLVVRASIRHFLIPRVRPLQRTLVMAAGELGETLARKIRKHPQYNIDLVGFLDDDPHPLAAGL